MELTVLPEGKVGPAVIMAELRSGSNNCLFVYSAGLDWDLCDENDGRSAELSGSSLN
jgi:hypothetical protein